MADVHQPPTNEPTPPARLNPVLDYLEHVTAAEDATQRHLAERDRETANDPDPDALPSLPDAK